MAKRLPKSMTAEQFNALFRIGTTVRYFPIAGDRQFEESRTRTEAWTLGHGATVVSIEGRAGGVLLTHLHVPDRPRERACRHCGCTEHQACPEGCWWTGDTLCSACTPSIEGTIAALCLVSGTDHITDYQVKTWTVDERADAFHWAMAAHYHASDNDVAVPPRPAFTVAAHA